jgi:hypothetical protein
VAFGYCAAATVAQDAITAVPEAGRAVIIGWGNTAGEHARAALKGELGARVTRLFVSHVNSQKTSFGENIARMPPGEYDLTIACGIYINYRAFEDVKVVHATVGANRVYRLHSELEGRRCQPYLEDVTDKGG